MDADSLEQIRVLWEGDALMDIGRLWPAIAATADDLDDVICQIEEHGRLDAALLVEADTLDAMRKIASKSWRHA